MQTTQETSQLQFSTPPTPSSSSQISYILEISKYVRYDPSSGAFTLCVPNVQNVQNVQGCQDSTQAQIITKNIQPNEDHYLVFSVKRKTYKVRAIKAAYCLWFIQHNKPVPVLDANTVLYSKNLNKQDYRFCNIGVCSRETMFKISEAQRNLHGDLKLCLHPTDMFSYVVQWTELRQKKKKVVHDVVLAKKLFLRLQLKFSKVLAKYLVLE